MYARERGAKIQTKQLISRVKKILLRKKLLKYFSHLDSHIPEKVKHAVQGLERQSN